MAPVKGLGLIVRTPSAPMTAVLVGVPVAALGSLGVYHTFGSVPAVRSTWAKIGLVVGGIMSLGLTFDGFALMFMGVKEMMTPTPAPEAVVDKTQFAGMGRVRGLGRFASQPALLVGQDHWLDRDYPDRYSEWWVGHHARR